MTVSRFNYKWIDNCTEMTYDVVSFHLDDDYALVVFNDCPEMPNDEVKLSDGVLIQSLGLADKNGKEVFEGDKLKISYTDSKGQKKSIIRSIGYCEQKLSYECYDNEACKKRMDFHKRFSFDDVLYYYGTGNPLEYIKDKDFEVEVINNIHENKELINDIK